MSLDLTPAERSELAEQVAAELDTGQYGDKYVLSRRQLLTLATATGGGGVLAALGADGAAAQASDDTSTGTVRGESGGGVDVSLDQLRDPTGDEVLNIDDTGAIDATLREWVFDQLTATSGDFNSLSTDSTIIKESLDATGLSVDNEQTVGTQWLSHSGLGGKCDKSVSSFDVPSDATIAVSADDSRVGLVIVSGGVENTSFCDVLNSHAAFYGEVDVISRTQNLNPVSRTYSATGSLGLSLGGDGSENYNIVVSRTMIQTDL